MATLADGRRVYTVSTYSRLTHIRSVLATAQTRPLALAVVRAWNKLDSSHQGQAAWTEAYQDLRKAIIATGVDPRTIS